MRNTFSARYTTGICSHHTGTPFFRQGLRKVRSPVPNWYDIIVKTRAYTTMVIWPGFILSFSVPDPKLIISDPDTQIENHEFRIRILLRNRDVKKKISDLVNTKTQMGWTCVWNYDEFAHFKVHFKTYFWVRCEKGEDPDLEPEPKSIIADPDPWGQIITDPGGFGSGTLLSLLLFSVPRYFRSVLISILIRI